MASTNPRRRAPSPSSDGESGPSPQLNMSLRKSATFHSPPSSPTLSTLDDFVPPSLSRSHTLLDVVDANCRRIAMTLDDIDKTLAQSDDLSPTPRALSSKHLRDNSLPFPRRLLDLLPAIGRIGSDEPRSSQLRPTRRSKDQDSDSGLGSSVASTTDKRVTATKSHVSAPALMGSERQALPALRQRTYSRILDHILCPLLERPDLQDFRPVVLEVPRRIKAKDIVCLRDLEKTLIFMAPGLAKTAKLYLKFCMSSIRCIQATFEHIPDREQIRAGDRPYTNGYFIDLKEQIIEYGRQLHAARKGGATEDMNVDPTDEVKLYGGVAENGRPAELVRVKKDGTAISMATGKPVDMGKSPVQFKRSLSEQRDDEEEIMRSMARRKKNASPEELAPKRCSEPGCHKEFKRPCDLTKHEKTHSRPWKCPVATCKYREFGWPTEKEMDRHVNDKHSNAPAMFECMYKPCAYKSKRQSNCKQHMEKAHGWNYVRSKTNGKKASPKPASPVQQTPPLGNESTPSTTPAYSAPTPPEEPELEPRDFSVLHADAYFVAGLGLPAAGSGPMDLGMDSAPSAPSYEQYPAYHDGSTFILHNEDIYAAQMQLPAHVPTVNQLYGKALPQQLPIYSGLPLNPAPQMQQHPVPQMTTRAPFSAFKEGSATLFSPDSMLDEGFDETPGPDGADFQLFPANVNRANDYQSLFEGVPSANLSFSQTSQPDILQQLDWPAVDYPTFQ